MYNNNNFLSILFLRKFYCNFSQNFVLLPKGIPDGAGGALLVTIFFISFTIKKLRTNRKVKGTIPLKMVFRYIP